MTKKHFHDEFGGQVKPGSLGQFTVLVNNPMDVNWLGEKLEKTKRIIDHYEFIGVKGKWKNTLITVLSTGIGGGSASIAIDNLAKLRVKTVIYIGVYPINKYQIRQSSIYIASGAIRMDGASIDYIPIDFPAVADPILISKAIDLTRQSDLKIQTCLFFCDAGPSKQSQSELENIYHQYQYKPTNRRPIAVKAAPEIATILTLAGLYNIHGAAFQVFRRPEETKEGLSELFNFSLNLIQKLELAE
jgi:uridine phosphorylase